MYLCLSPVVLSDYFSGKLLAILFFFVERSVNFRSKFVLSELRSMSSSVEYTFSTRAYVKMLLHSLKYPHRPVTGVLLARAKQSKSDSSPYAIVDTIPLFHHTCPLAPSWELALAQVDAYTSQSAPAEHLIILGVYQAAEHLRDMTASPTTYRIADKLHSFNPDALLLVIDNQALSIDFARVIYKPYGMTELKWKAKERGRIGIEDEEFSCTSACAQAKLYRELYDFDNHLDDLSCDWLNRKLNSKIDSLND